MAQQAAENITPPSTDSSADDTRPSDAPSLDVQMQGMSVKLHGTCEDSLADVRGEYMELMEDLQTLGEEAEERAPESEYDDEGGPSSTIGQVQSELRRAGTDRSGFH